MELKRAGTQPSTKGPAGWFTGSVRIAYPAAINTELLSTISHKASADNMQALYRQYGISAERIAEVVTFAIDLPEDTTVNEFTVGPANQPW